MSGSIDAFLLSMKEKKRQEDRDPPCVSLFRFRDERFAFPRTLGVGGKTF